MPWTKMLVERQDAVLDENSGEGNRILSYSDSIREAFALALEKDPNVYIMGQGVDDPSGLFGTTLRLQEQFGKERVFDTPLSEHGLMGMAIGSAITGMRPIYIHNRPDFLLMAMDQIVNHAAKWRYMFGGQGRVPLVIWSVIGRGWGSGAQHSQALQGLFMHIPGLKIVMPSTAYDAKGLLLEAVADNNPVLIMEHRWVLRRKGFVPEAPYRIPFGRGVIRRIGKDVTIAGVSHAIIEAQQAAEELCKDGIEAEVIDFRTLKPWDLELLLSSLSKTGRLVLVDTGWRCNGAISEIAATVVEKAFDLLRSPIKRVACKDIPTPAGYTLEAAFYPSVGDIRDAVAEIMS